MKLRLLLALSFGLMLGSSSAQVPIGPGSGFPIGPNIGGGGSGVTPPPPVIVGGLTFGSVNTPSIQVDVGSQSVLQFDRNQPWTAIDYLTLSTPPAPGGASVMFTTSNQGAVATGGNAFTGYEWWIDPNCHQRVRIINNFGINNYLGVIGSINVCDGIRHKLAVSYDGSSTAGGVSFYVDGNVDASGTEGRTLSGSIVNSQPFFIGNQRGWPYSIGGKLEFFSLSSVVRSQSWVEAYSTASGSVDASTLLAYDFSENAGKITSDSSSNSFTASVDNAVWQPSGVVGNAPFIVQGAMSIDAGATPATSKSASLPANVTSGNTIAGAVYCQCTTGLTVTDDKGNTYIVLGPDTTLAGVEYWQFYALNITNSPHTVTAALTSSTGAFWRVVIDEITNIQPIVDGSSIAYTAAAAGTDGITSGPITTTGSGDFIWGASVNYDITAVTAGTNFSIQESAISVIDKIYSEYFWQQVAGTVAATFTPSSTVRAHASGIAFQSGRPCYQYGGYCIGQQGVPGTIYAGHILTWADDFTGPLDIVGPQTPKGRYFTTKGYSVGPRGNGAPGSIDQVALGISFDTDPFYTGYNDSNRGVPINYNNMIQTGGVLQLQARSATVQEQAGFYPTAPNINGGIRPLVSSGINSAGAVAVYPSNMGSTIVESFLKYSAGSPAGAHPTFWISSVTPVISYTTNEWDMPEENSIQGGNSASFNQNNWVNGVPTSTLGTFFSTLFDGNYHWSSAVLANGTAPSGQPGAANTTFYIDGALQQTYTGVNSNSKNKPLYFLITEHVLSSAYNPAPWIAGGSATISDKMVRIWIPVGGTAKHWTPSPTAPIPDLQVSYAGSGTISIPSAAAIWGDPTVTEFLQIDPDEANEPGMSASTSFQTGGSVICPSGVICNIGTRTINVNFNGIGGNAGVMHGLLYGFKPDSSSMVPARFTIYRGPHISDANQVLALNASVTYDVRKSCDVGIATPPKGAPIITNVSNLPSGLSFNSSTEIISGTYTTPGTAIITCVNNQGQPATANINFFTCTATNSEACALLNRFDALPDNLHQGYVDTAISCLKSNNVWADLDVLNLALNDQFNSLLNWKGTSFNSTTINSPSFIPYRGFTGNGVTNGSYVDVGYQPGISGGSNQNSLAALLYSLTSGQQANASGFSFNAPNSPLVGTTVVPRSFSDTLSFRVNSSTATDIPNTDGSGLITIKRNNDSSNQTAWSRGIQLGTAQAATSSAPAISDAGIGHAIGATSYSTLQAFGWGFGPAYSDGDEPLIYGCLHTYAQNVGAE